MSPPPPACCLTVLHHVHPHPTSGWQACGVWYSGGRLEHTDDDGGGGKRRRKCQHTSDFGGLQVCAGFLRGGARVDWHSGGRLGWVWVWRGQGAVQERQHMCGRCVWLVWEGGQHAKDAALEAGWSGLMMMEGTGGIRGLPAHRHLVYPSPCSHSSPCVCDSRADVTNYSRLHAHAWTARFRMEGQCSPYGGGSVTRCLASTHLAAHQYACELPLRATVMTVQ